jgi:hypothetical protein
MRRVRSASGKHGLVDTAQSGSWDAISETVLRTMHGTSLRIAAKRDARVAEFIAPTEHLPVEIGEIIKALDRFVAAGGEPGRHSQVKYSFLCEFAHPARRGIRTYFDVADFAGGWTIQYREDDPTTVLEAEYFMVLETVLENMRYGYAAAELLRRSRVEGVYPHLELKPPSRTDLRYVWLRLLQRPTEA